MQQLREGLAPGGTTVEAAVVRAPPFWNLVGIVDCPEIIEQTRDWVRSRLPLNQRLDTGTQ